MKKILFIVTQSEFGGAQRYIYEIATNLDPQKYEVLIAAGEENGELFRKFQIPNSKFQIRTKKLNYLKRVPWPWQAFLSILEIFNLLKKEKPAILFLCSSTAGLLGSLAAFFYRFQITDYRLQVIYRIGGWSFRDPRFFLQNWFLIFLEKLTSSLKDKIIVNSEIDYQLARKYKIVSKEKLVKIYNGIDEDSLNFFSKKEARDYFSSKFKVQSSKLDLKSQNSKFIGCVANFYKTKGLKYLIKAAYILDSRFKIKDLKFLIIGEGKEREKLEKLIKKYNLKEKVFLVGRVPKVYQYLKAFDLLVLPSLKEGMPWIILEAMAAEIPIIATKIGALPEIIDNKKEGILIEPKNSQILAKKIFWLLNHQKEAQEMAKRAKEKLKNFTLEKMLKETEKIL
jgi:glycosyltransferase involved in cell wall biosynthesis